MIERRGIAVSQGVVIAEAFVLDREDVTIAQRFVTPETMPEECERLEGAIAEISEEIDQLRQKADAEIGLGSGHISMEKPMSAQCFEGPLRVTGRNRSRGSLWRRVARSAR